MISALAAGTGGKRYSIIFQAFASGFDYSIKNGYGDVFGRGFGKKSNDAFSDLLGTGMSRALPYTASKGNSLGSYGLETLSGLGGHFTSEQIKQSSK